MHTEFDEFARRRTSSISASRNHGLRCSAGPGGRAQVALDGGRGLGQRYCAGDDPRHRRRDLVVLRVVRPDLRIAAKSAWANPLSRPRTLAGDAWIVRDYHAKRSTTDEAFWSIFRARCVGS